MQHVFVYGSLLFPEIVSGLTGHSFQTMEAHVKNYQRCAIKEVDYPGLIEKSNSQVNGKVLLNVDQRSFEVLRFFEGDEYRCIDVEVQTNNEKLIASMFIWVGPDAKLDKRDWDPAVFERNALPDYVRFIVPETVKEFKQSFP